MPLTECLDGAEEAAGSADVATERIDPQGSGELVQQLLVYSTTSCPGFRRPSRSAPSIMARAMRSL
jgi:hypothetical protein